MLRKSLFLLILLLACATDNPETAKDSYQNQDLHVLQDLNNPDTGKRDTSDIHHDSNTNGQDNNINLPKYQFLSDKGYAKALLDAINRAQNLIYMTELEFRTGSPYPDAIRYALKNAKKRGVDIKVILEDSVEGNSKVYNWFKGNGITVKWDGNHSLLHAKVVIIDSEEVFVGSTNMSWSSLSKNHETDAVVRSVDVARSFEQYFLNIWSSPTHRYSISCSDPYVECMGDDSYERMVEPIIDHAKTRIRLVMYQITEASRKSSPGGALVNALVKAARRGVDIRVILERTDYKGDTNSDNQKAADILRSSGVQVRFDPDTVITHAKLLIVDSKTVIYTGNWTYQGLRKNHEAGVIIDKDSVVSAAYSYFEKVWATCH